MPIRVDCSCGHKFAAPSKYAGKKVKCPKCSKPLVVPVKKVTEKAKAQPVAADKRAAKPKTNGNTAIPVHCKCGKSFAAKPELQGKTVKCPACKSLLRVGGVSKKKSKPAQVPALPPAEDPFSDIGLVPVDGGTGRKCPECKSPMGEDAILCINCGFNERLGRKMEVERPLTQEDRDKAHMDKVLTGDSNSEKTEKKRGWFGRKKK